MIAASNRDLRKAVERGTFREDLFYRLHVFDIQIPPLRERRADIVPLSESDAAGDRQVVRPAAGGLTQDARQALLQHDWPGNVRELRNVLERAAILCDGAPIDPAISPALRQQVTPQRHDRPERRPTNHYCKGPARVRRKQNAGGAATWIVTDAASPPDSKVPHSRKLLSRNRPCSCRTRSSRGRRST